MHQRTSHLKSQRVDAAVLRPRASSLRRSTHDSADSASRCASGIRCSKYARPARSIHGYFSMIAATRPLHDRRSEKLGERRGHRFDPGTRARERDVGIDGKAGPGRDRDVRTSTSSSSSPTARASASHETVPPARRPRRRRDRRCARSRPGDALPRAGSPESPRLSRESAFGSNSDSRPTPAPRRDRAYQRRASDETGACRGNAPRPTARSRATRPESGRR